MPLVQVRRQQDPHRVPEQAHRARALASGTAATAPTASTRSPSSRSRRTPTVSTSTPRSSSGSLAAGKRIVEVPIPTYYGDEICYVNGVRVRPGRHDGRRPSLGAAGGASAVASRRPEPDSYAVKAEHGSHAVLLNWLADQPVGAGTRCRLLRRPVRRARPGPHGPHTWPGSTWSSSTAWPSGSTSSSRRTSTSRSPTPCTATFDVVVAGDILEHVVEPHSLLVDLRRALAPGGEILVSVPNFGPLVPPRPDRPGPLRLRPAWPAGPWPPAVLHPAEIETLIARAACGSSSGATVGTPFDIFEEGRRAPGRHRTRIDPAATRVWPRMFRYQFLYRLERCDPHPDRRRPPSRRTGSGWPWAASPTSASCSTTLRLTRTAAAERLLFSNLYDQQARAC